MSEEIIDTERNYRCQEKDQFIERKLDVRKNYGSFSQENIDDIKIFKTSIIKYYV